MEVPKGLQTIIINVLRRYSQRWKSKTDAKKDARVPVGHYSSGRVKYQWKCAICEDVFKAKDTVMDHKDPVVPIQGFKVGHFDFNEFICRMFVGKAKYQCLCKPCHTIKTNDENVKRKAYKKK